MIKNSEELKDFIINCLEEKKANDIITLDLQDKTNLVRYMIIASGTSIKNIASIADYISLELKHKTNYKIIIEGLGKSDWVIVDANEVMVHLLHPDMRSQLQLEKLWSKPLKKA